MKEQEKDTAGWKFLSEEPAFKRFITITIQKFRGPDNKEYTFDILKTPHAAVVFARNSEKHILGVKQFRPGPGIACYDIPGGYIDEGEAPADAAARELLEETGYAGDTPQYAGSVFSGPYANCKIYVYVIENVKKVGEQNLDASEFMDVAFHTKEEVDAWISECTTSQTAPILLAYRYLNLAV